MSSDATDAIACALQAALPPEHQAQAAALARAIAARRLDPALRPALQALAGQELQGGDALITFGSGSQIGDVTIAGDVVGRDKITISLAAPVPQLRPQERRNRQAMLQKVRAIWVDGLLRHSLAEAVRIDLGLTERPDAVQLPLHTQYQELRRPPRDLPPDTQIVDAFDESGGALLILGAPGAGKTTLLLELCRDLLARAERDETRPIPVVFNLSSWTTKRGTIDDWLVEELRARYEVPQKIAQGWAADNLILPLLDGLDEVAPDQRAACVEAINAYRATHLVPLAISSRIADYESQSTQLRLHKAVLVQPLTPTQVNTYLTVGGDTLEGLREMVMRDAALHDLAQTPLMLSIMALTYQGTPTETLRTAVMLEEEQRYLWDAYITHMFRRRMKKTYFAPKQTLTWLSWLARRMLAYEQTVFLIEQLQPEWLGTFKQKLAYVTIVLLIITTVGVLPLAFSLGMLNVILYISIIILSTFKEFNKEASNDHVIKDKTLHMSEVILPANSLSQKVVKSWQFTQLKVKVKVKIPIVAHYVSTQYITNIKTVDAVSWSWSKAKSGLAIGLSCSLTISLIYACILAINTMHSVSVLFLNTFLSTFPLIHFFILIRGLSAKGISQSETPNQGIWRSIHSAIRAGLRALLASSSVLVTCIAIIIISYILIRLVLVDLLAKPSNFWTGHSIAGFLQKESLSQSITPTPSVTVTPISTPRPVTVTPISTPNSFLPHSTPIVPWNPTSIRDFGSVVNVTLEFVTSKLLVSSYFYFINLLYMLPIMLTKGGLTFIQHFTLRLILSYSGTLPLRLVPFLNACADRALLRRVGGGYIFTHRLLMEHFASLSDDDIARLSAEVNV